MKSAERACRQQMKAEQHSSAMLATLEVDYLDLYNVYQGLIAQFKSGTACPGKSSKVQQHLVRVMGDLSLKAKQLISLKSLT
jgi:hypothetical protein